MNEPPACTGHPNGAVAGAVRDLPTCDLEPYIRGPFVWSDQESKVITSLESTGFSPIEARVVTAMVSRRYARERAKLVDVLSGHVGLEDTAVIGWALQGLISRGLLNAINYDGRSLITVAPDLSSRLQATGSPDSANLLKALENTPVHRFQSVGLMTDQTILPSFRDAVSSAQHTIRLPFFESMADLEGIDELYARARAGVAIKIMLGSPHVMSEIRGAAHRKRATRAVESWVSKTRDWPNTEVRIATTAKDIECGSSMSVDGRLLRFDVHEPLVERSLMGEMLVVNEAGGNLIRLFNSSFDSAWRRARPTRGMIRARRILYSWRWTFATVVAVACAAVFAESTWRELLLGMSGTAFFAALDENRARIVALWERIKGV